MMAIRKRDFYKMLPVILCIMFLFISANIFAYAQKTANSQSYHVQNNDKFVIPDTNNFGKNFYNLKSINYTVATNSSKLFPINNTISYIITNATITVNEKIVKGLGSSTVKQIFTEPSETILFAKRY